MALLDIENLSVWRGGRRVLDNVSLRVDPGRILALLGWSGAGKSSLLLAIAGLLESGGRVEGEIHLDGKPLTHIPAHRRGIPLVLQELGLFQHMSAVDNVAFPLRVRGVGRENARKKARLELQKLGIGRELQGKGPLSLSGGQRQRVALARALVTDPQLVMLDEPTSALDAVTASRFAELLCYLKEDRGFAALVATHDRSFATAIADELAILDGQTIVQAGSADELYYSPRHESVVQLLAIKNVFKARRVSDGSVEIETVGAIRLQHDEIGASKREGLLLLRDGAFDVQHDRPSGEGGRRALRVYPRGRAWVTGRQYWLLQLAEGAMAYYPADFGADNRLKIGVPVWLVVRPGGAWFF